MAGSFLEQLLSSSVFLITFADTVPQSLVYLLYSFPAINLKTLFSVPVNVLDVSRFNVTNEPNLHLSNICVVKFMFKSLCLTLSFFCLSVQHTT